MASQHCPHRRRPWSGTIRYPQKTTHPNSLIRTAAPGCFTGLPDGDRLADGAGASELEPNKCPIGEGAPGADHGRPFAPPHAGHWAHSSAREIGYPALNCHAKLKALIESLMAIELGVLIVVQSVAKLYGVGVEVAKIQLGGLVLSSFSNPPLPVLSPRAAGSTCALPAERRRRQWPRCCL